MDTKYYPISDELDQSNGWRKKMYCTIWVFKDRKYQVSCCLSHKDETHICNLDQTTILLLGLKMYDRFIYITETFGLALSLINSNETLHLVNEFLG